MRRKWIGRLIVLLLLVLFAVLYVTNESNKIAAAENSAEIDSKPKLNIQLPANKQAKIQESKEPLDLSPKDEIDGVPMLQWLAEINNPVYSDDPVLEVVTLSMDFRMCKYPMQRLVKKTAKHPELKVFMDHAKAKCETYAEQYPLWFNVRDREQSVMSLPTSSIFGEQYKHILAGYYGKHSDLDFDQLNEARLELSLQIKSPSLVSFGALDSGIGITATLDKTAFFMGLLKSKVGIWIYQAHELALQSFSCELPNSRSCEATSFYMLYKCENETAACGLSFQQWYESYTTVGMKKDVEI
ncbi:hypothetical protein MNBD_GAMMA02-309, partial [hydrothermal vent metagenome]